MAGLSREQLYYQLHYMGALEPVQCLNIGDYENEYNLWDRPITPHFPPKPLLTFNGLHEVLSQNIEFFIITVAGNSNFKNDLLIFHGSRPV